MPYLFFVLLTATSPVWATAASAPIYTPPPPVISSGGLLQMIASLLLVLGLIVLVGWLLKRSNFAQHTASAQQMKVLASLPLGQRERVVLLLVRDTCLVLGIGPGQIRTLHSFPKPDDLPLENDPKAAPQFAQLLSSLMKPKDPK